jgi:hypothetical protein
MDRSSRSYDPDGHLRIENNLITAAGLSDYVGSEIPDYQKYGLQPNRLYTLLRPESELKRAAPSLRGKPLLSRHIETTAANHASDDVCGAVGSDVVYDNGVVRASLVVWTADAIKGIEDGDCRSLSAGYYYELDPKPGTYQSQPYIGQMKSLQFNHVALVLVPRVVGAMVGDSKPKDRSMDMDQFDPLVKFLQERLEPDDMDKVDSMLQYLCDPDNVAQPDSQGDPPAKRKPAAAMAGDSRSYFTATGHRRPVAPTASQVASRNAMFPHGSRLNNGWR